MLYLTRSLYTDSDKPNVMYVVDVRQGVVESYFPFDCERQSMKFVNAIFLSANGKLDECGDASCFPPTESLPKNAILYAYEVVTEENGFSLKLLN